jgi:hypothetical protein
MMDCSGVDAARKKHALNCERERSRILHQKSDSRDGSDTIFCADILYEAGLCVLYRWVEAIASDLVMALTVG